MTSFPRPTPGRPLRVVLPRPPQPSPPHSFPFLATLAPVIASLALWSITSSPFALMFAALGPVIAIASVGDAGITSRRARRKENERFERDRAATRSAIDRIHARERRELESLAPGAHHLVTSSSHDPEHWRSVAGAPVPVRLGQGAVPSLIELPDDTDDTLLDLCAAASSVPAAPVVVDARLGIGLCGPRPLAVAAARALVVQLAAALSPAVTRVSASAGASDGATTGASAWDWLERLPHQTADPVAQSNAPPGVTTVVFTAVSPATAPEPITVAVADSPDHLPRQARVAVRVGAGESVILRHPDPAVTGVVRSEFVSLEEVLAWAEGQTDLARREGVLPPAALLPDLVELGGILATSRTPRGSDGSPDAGQGVAGAGDLLGGIGAAEDGVLAVDLVHDGPHAVVGGTTGSGKSELLVSWVLAMAAGRSPSVVSFLCVDFKGGASFEALRDLPHCVGLITDLDSREALRALVSLSAEVRHRERLLAARAVRSIDDVPEGALFPRLVIVVDEYAAIVEEHPDLHALFTDLAARGRSLGIHLVLCTQRPAGVVRDSILANCGLRLSLRVNNRADSSAVIGSDDAAALPALPRGRALVSAAGEAPRLFQVARSSRRDVAAVAEAWAGVPRPRRPWCEPLPSRVTFADLNGLADLEGGGYLEDGLDLDDDDDGVRVRGRGRGRAEDAGVPFALADLPEEQRHAVARYRPHTHGHLLVVGAAGAGKSGVLAALMAAPSGVVTERVAGQLAVVWDVVAEPLGVGREPRLLLFDDIDAVIQAAPEEYMMAVLDQFARLLREGPAYGVHVVITAQRIGGPLHQLTALCGSTLVLRMPNRQEHLLAGGETGDWSRDLPPGAGTWRGNRIQVIQAARVSAGAGPLTSGCATDGIGLHRTVDPSQPVPGAPPIVIVSTRPARMSRRMRAANPSLAVVDIGGTATDPRELIVTRGAARPVLIGDPESWQSHWGALGALKATSDILFDAVSTGDFRLLTGLRELPPPPPRGERPLWLLSPDGIVSRARLAGPLSTQAGTAGAD